MTEMFGEAWPPMSVPDLAPDDDDDEPIRCPVTPEDYRMTDHWTLKSFNYFAPLSASSGDDIDKFMKR